MLPDTLKRAIVEAGVLGEADLAELETRARDAGEELETLIVRKGFCTEESLLDIVAGALGMEFMRDVASLRPSPAFVERIGREFARRHRIMGFDGQNGSMVAAIARPEGLHAVDEASCRLGVDVKAVIAREEDILSAINAAYEDRNTELSSVLDDISDLDMEGITREVERTEDLMDMATRAPIVRLVNSILSSALPLRATDVHLQPFEKHLRVRYRIDGILYDKMEIPKEIQEAVISRIKIMGKLDIAERRRPQDGGMSFTSSGRNVDVRISAVPSQHGERIVLRLQDKSTGLYDLVKLGLDARDLATIKRLLNLSHGIILVTGPTGSGKTTTLYSALKSINAPDLNIITIEDPVEYLLEGVSQIQVSNKSGLTFASGLRSIVRQDPDVIMVGEIRDFETLSIAIQAALTGHLVFSTLHTNDSAGAVSRMLDLGAEPYLVNSAVLAVVAQRLIRLVCPSCREPGSISEQDLADLKLKPSDAEGRTVYRGRGCDACDRTGYLGRTGIYEILVVDDDVRGQIARRESGTDIKKKAVEKGLKTLRDDAIQKMFAGLTTAEEVVRNTQLDNF